AESRGQRVEPRGGGGRRTRELSRREGPGRQGERPTPRPEVPGGIEGRGREVGTALCGRRRSDHNEGTAPQRGRTELSTVEVLHRTCRRRPGNGAGGRS